MATVHFTPHLKRYFPELRSCEIESASVAELVRALELRHAGLASYLVDDRGRLRQHVVIYVDKVAVFDRATLSDALRSNSVVHVFQALSGG